MNSLLRNNTKIQELSTDSWRRDFSFCLYLDFVIDSLVCTTYYIWSQRRTLLWLPSGNVYKIFLHYCILRRDHGPCVSYFCTENYEWYVIFRDPPTSTTITLFSLILFKVLSGLLQEYYWILTWPKPKSFEGGKRRDVFQHICLGRKETRGTDGPWVSTWRLRKVDLNVGGLVETQPFFVLWRSIKEHIVRILNQCLGQYILILTEVEKDVVGLTQKLICILLSICCRCKMV